MDSNNKFVGGLDIHHAVATEAQRIVKQSKGDSSLIVRDLLSKLVEFGVITETDSRAAQRAADLGFEAAEGRRKPEAAYIESRQILDGLLASPDSSDTAIALVSAMAGSYEYVEGSGDKQTVVYKKTGEWEGRLGAIGALIGAGSGGVGGAAIGGLIGSAVGKVVDDCTDA